MRFKAFLEKAKVVGKVSNFVPETDEVTKSDLNALEKQLDKIFAKINIDIAFTKHFLDRVNDARNKKQITIAELRKLFTLEFQKHAKDLEKFKDHFEAMFKDRATKINVPFVLQYDKKNNEMDLVAKTVMRKADFKTHTRVLNV